jgi:hypothetical protein
MEPIKGRVLKLIDPKSGASLCGVLGFLMEWQVDALNALSTCTMGDRDSYPGDYLARLVEEGFLDRVELERIILQWFEGGRYKPKDNSRKYWPYMGFDDVLSVATILKLESVLEWLVLHFDELYPALKKAGCGDVSEGRILVDAVQMARNFELVIPQLTKILEEDPVNKIRIFDTVYVKSKQADRQLAQQFLVHVCKQMRCQFRHRPELAGSSVSTLRYTLMEFFGYTYPRGQKEPGLFEAVGAKADRWLVAQNAHMPFPVR